MYNSIFAGGKNSAGSHPNPRPWIDPNSKLACVRRPCGLFRDEAIQRAAGAKSPRACYDARMIRIREIIDPELRLRIIDALARRRGCSGAAIPEWFELDDADYVDLLNDLLEDSEHDADDSRD